MLLREADRAIGLIERVAAGFTDHREAEQVVHALPTLIGQRIVAIALGYEDINDHDALRRDPVLALFSDQPEAKRKDCAPLAGKSTINRLEHAPREGGDRYHKIDHDPQALERVFIDVFLDAYGPPPEEIVLDLDATDDPLHGHQEVPRLLRLLLLPAVPCLLRPASLGGEAPALEHRRRGEGRGGAPRGPHPAALAEGADRAARR